MAAHARLKNKFTEDKKGHNLISWLISLSTHSSSVRQSPSVSVQVNMNTIEVVVMKQSPISSNVCIHVMRLWNQSFILRPPSKTKATE